MCYLRSLWLRARSRGIFTWDLYGSARSRGIFTWDLHGSARGLEIYLLGVFMAPRGLGVYLLYRCRIIYDTINEIIEIFKHHNAIIYH